MTGPSDTAAFGARLASRVAERGPLCAGLDPHPGLLRAWGLADDVTGLDRFARTATEVLAPRVAVLKPQSAFFEAYGSVGLAVLERVVARARAAGTMVLLDVKRGDIGSTMAAYAAAYLADGAALAADAITVSPYLGFGSLQPALSAARTAGAGVFVLARTSNPDAAWTQRALLPDGRTLAQSIVDEVAARNAAGSSGDVGVVVGATTEPDELDLNHVGGPILAPGFGAQGGTVADLRRLFGAHTARVLPVAARSILEHGPDPTALDAAARDTADAVRPLTRPGDGSPDD